MADERKIVIELVAKGADEEEEKKDKEDKEAKKRAKKIKQHVFSIMQSVGSEVFQQTLYEVSRYTNLSEDYKTQIFVNNTKATVDKVKKIGGYIKNTAILTATLGGAGTAIGITEAIIDVGNQVIDLIRQYQEQATNLAMQDKASAYARSRLGLVDNGRGTYN